MHKFDGSWASLLAVLACVLACEEQAATPETAAASAAPAAATAAALAPPEPTTATDEPAPARPERPKKKFEDCPSDVEVAFPDAEFEAAVRLKLQQPSGPIKKTQLKRLTSLNVTRSPLDELDVCVFHYMTGLKELFLGKGQVNDLGPIAGATRLESLRASLNPIEDLSPLEKMTKMDRLDLGHTQVKDLAPLGAMTSLTELMLDDTPVEDLAPIAKLTKMERLSIQRTQVKDVSMLKDMKALKFIYAEGAPVAEDFMAFAPLRKNGTKAMLD